jgi:hypothetical protein
VSLQQQLQRRRQQLAQVQLEVLPQQQVQRVVQQERPEA